MAVEYKQIPADLKVSAGEFEGHCAIFDQIDRAGEVIERGAFARHLPRFRKAGLILHNHERGAIVASVKDAFEDSRGLYVKGEFHTTQRARDLRTVMLERSARGQSNEMSIGYFVHADAPDRKSRARRLLDVEVLEASIVDTACQSLALVASVKGANAMSSASPAARLSLLRDLREHYTGRSAGEALTLSNEYKSGRLNFSLSVPSFSKAALTSPAEFHTAPPFTTAPPRRATVIDMMNEVESARGTHADYSIISIPSGALVVAEGAVKPYALWTVTPAYAPYEVIAAALRVSRSVFSDVENVRALIDTALSAAVRYAEEARAIAVIQGTAGTQTASGALPAVAATAAAAIRNAGYTPTAIVLNPTNLAAATGGAGYALSPIDGSEWLAGMRVIASPAIALGVALAGDFSAATVYRHSQAVLKTATQGDDIIKNLLLVLAESSIGIGVVTPPAFCEITITA